MTATRASHAAVVVEEHVQFSFEELCSACSADPSTLQALILEGLLEPRGNRPADWHFEGSALPRALMALRLARDLRLSTDATVLVVDLLEEIGALRARLHRAGLI
jgi:chaperone modulatory protein CbpM